MKTKLIFAAALALAAAAPGVAATVLNVTDFDGSTSYNFSITAASGSTDVAFAGYNLPSFIDVSNIDLSADSNPTVNLLASTFTFTAAPFGSDAFTQNGANGVQDLFFGAVVVGSYDTYSQTVATTAGSSYHLSFNYDNYL